MFLSWSTLMQHALDALPDETMRARRDLQVEYGLLDASVEVLTNISMFQSFPNYPTSSANSISSREPWMS